MKRSAAPKVDGFAKVTTFTGTWLGRAGKATDYLLKTSAVGPRVYVHRWTDTGETTISAITGDAWKKPEGFREFSKITLSGEQATDAAVEQQVRVARDALLQAIGA